MAVVAAVARLGYWPLAEHVFLCAYGGSSLLRPWRDACNAAGVPEASMPEEVTLAIQRLQEVVAASSVSG